MSVSVSVSVSLYVFVRDHIFGTTPPIFNFLRMLPMSVDVARASSGGVVICYVFPVLRMTSFLPYAEAARRRRQAEAARLTRTHPWAWRVGIPVAGSGRSGPTWPKWAC